MRALALILAACLASLPGAALAAAKGPEEVSAPQQQQQDAQPAAPGNGGFDDKSDLDEERARLRDELLRDRAADFKARSAMASAGESERMRRDLQVANRERAAERGRVVLAQRGEGSGEATEEAREVSTWARQEQLTARERERRAFQGGVKVDKRQGYNSMVSGMQAWASGKNVSNTRKENRSNRRRGSDSDEDDDQ